MLKKILAYKIQLIIGALLVVGVAGGIGVGYSISQNTKDSVSDILPNNSEVITVNETNEVEENNVIEEEPVVAPVQEKPKTTTKPKTSKNNITTTKNTTTNTSVKNEEKNTIVEQPKQEEPKTTTKTVIIDLESLIKNHSQYEFQDGLKVNLQIRDTGKTITIYNGAVDTKVKNYSIEVEGEGEKTLVLYVEGGLKYNKKINTKTQEDVIRIN